MSSSSTVTIYFANTHGEIFDPVNWQEPISAYKYHLEDGKKYNLGDIHTGPQHIIVVDRRAGYGVSELCLVKLATTLKTIVDTLYGSSRVIMRTIRMTNSIDKAAEFEINMLKIDKLVYL